MNDQQMQFFEREPYPEGEAHAVNRDPREQQMILEGPTYGQKLRPIPAQSRRRSYSSLWFLLIPLILVFIVMGGVMGSGTFFGSVMPDMHMGIPDQHQLYTGTQTFQVTDTPTILISGFAGDISIHVGAADQVVVKTGGQMMVPEGDDERGAIRQEGNMIIVNTPEFSRRFFNAGGHLDITVPATANIGVKDTTGAVNINGVSGQMAISVDTGSINITQATLQGQSTINTDSGSINFQGALEPQGDYHFESVSGSIVLSLPSDAAFNLNVDVGTGSVHNDFGSSVVGNGTGPALSVQSVSGSISINKD